MMEQYPETTEDDHYLIFHGLYDHTQLHWKEILHIVGIDIDITLTLGINPKNILTTFL